MKLHALIALTQKGVMGKNNDLPWRLPNDLKRFKQLTLGHPVIMGRKTFESIGKPLPGRPNLILTRNKNFSAPNTQHFQDLDEALSYCEATLLAKKAFVIGGAEILKIAVPYFDELNLTWIDQDFDGDVFCPNLELEKYQVRSEVLHETPFPHRYTDYIRV